MPARKQPHEFTACEQFGTRYSALGKRIEASVPKGETAITRTYTSELDIFQLCDNLAVELEDPEAELEYIAQNRKNYYNTHSYMNDKAIGTAYDGPVFPDDIIYRRSSGEKYTVQADGSITTAAGRTYKAPDFQNFIHTFPKKGAAKKEAAPVLTLPKQDNPLVQGECKTRTPEEASRSAAKQREQARKEAAKTTEEQKPAAWSEEDEKIYQTVFSHFNSYRKYTCSNGVKKEHILSWLKSLRPQPKQETTEAEKETVREHYGPEAVAKILPDLDDVDFVNIFREEDRRRFGDRREPFFSLITDKELAEEVVRRGIVTMAMSLEDEPTETLLKELERRHTFEPEYPTKLSPLLTEKVEKKPEFFDYVSQVLITFDDKDLADELRRRGYTVTATRTIEI